MKKTLGILATLAALALLEHERYTLFFGPISKNQTVVNSEAIQLLATMAISGILLAVAWFCSRSRKKLKISLN